MLGATAAGVGGAASLVAGAGTADAANGGDVLLGKKNTATATTTVSTTKGNGLEGETSADSLAGLYGVDNSSGGGAGVQGTSKNSTGVLGKVTGDTMGQRAVYGIDETTGVFGGYGVVGTSSQGVAVYGRSTGGDGVEGFTTFSGASAVYGDDTSSGGGYGVYGTSDNGSGVYGTTPDESGLAYGVFAEAATTNYALLASGNALVTDTLSKGGGSFKIDHPLDPGGKYLYHSFVESPDMMNVTARSPSMAEGRPQLSCPSGLRRSTGTVATSSPPLAALRQSCTSHAEVKDGSFSIAGGKAGQKVSWQVTGIRQDAWANANRIPVEVEKKAEDRGRYLHPDLFGGEAITALARTRGHRRTKHATTT
jgi:hypothetical protein